MTKPHTRISESERVRPRLRVGLVNLMPDGALAATERQFRQLLTAAAPDRELETPLFEIPEITRDPAIRARMDGRYLSVDALPEADLDAMIVTGAKHEGGELKDAPFWPGLSGLIDLALERRLPTLWSCLAAHAAVEHLDGIKRRPMPTKYSGLFKVAPATDDPLLEGMPSAMAFPHSRWNDVAEADLAARGYQVLTRSDEVGVDAFARPGAPFLYCQGHPEYDADSLPLEYKRDFRAFLNGQRPVPPTIPVGVYTPETEEAFTALTRRALETRSPELMADWPAGDKASESATGWRSFAVGLYANWLRALV